MPSRPAAVQAQATRTTAAAATAASATAVATTRRRRSRRQQGGSGSGGSGADAGEGRALDGPDEGDAAEEGRVGVDLGYGGHHRLGQDAARGAALGGVGGEWLLEDPPRDIDRPRGAGRPSELATEGVRDEWLMRKRGGEKKKEGPVSAALVLGTGPKGTEAPRNGMERMKRLKNIISLGRKIGKGLKRWYAGLSTGLSTMASFPQSALGPVGTVTHDPAAQRRWVGSS